MYRKKLVAKNQLSRFPRFDFFFLDPWIHEKDRSLLQRAHGFLGFRSTIGGLVKQRTVPRKPGEDRRKSNSLPRTI